MPNKITEGQPVSQESTAPESASSFSRIRWGESYVSLILGALVVIVAAFLGFLYVKMHQPKQELLPPATIVRQIKLTVTPLVSQAPSTVPSKSQNVVKNNQQVTKEKIYIVQKNDNLWDIAQKIYGSGYNWVSIARANNLSNPGMVFSGDKLVIPSVTPIVVQNTVQQILPSITSIQTITPTISPTPTISSIRSMKENDSITGTEYIVRAGDSLWSIAIRAYENGYRWVDIAKANNLTNPSVIHSGNILRIPRKQTL